MVDANARARTVTAVTGCSSNWLEITDTGRPLPDRGHRASGDNREGRQLRPQFRLAVRFGDGNRTTHSSRSDHRWRHLHVHARLHRGAGPAAATTRAAVFFDSVQIGGYASAGGADAVN